MPLSGARIREYEVWGRLSEGGMSEVWLAKHSALAIPVIMKTMRSELGEDETQGFQRMLNEARLMARIASPRVVRAIDAGVHDLSLGGLEAPPSLDGTQPRKVGYVVQEYVDGIDLAELDTRRRGALGVGLPLWYTCHVMEETCLALLASHQTGIIHRDVKPSNIFGSPVTGIRLGDFGIAITSAESTTSDVSGTFRYMAPEQVRGDALGRATDVYGAGATAYDLRYGRPPYDDVRASLDPDVMPRFPMPQSPAEAYFQHVLRGMLAYDPARRPRDLGDLARHFGALERSLVPTGDRAQCTRIGHHRYRLGDCEIVFDTGDIADAVADGIVNSAHYHMQMRSGVGESLRERGGDDIEVQAMARGEQSLGSVVATGAGQLPARTILHAVSAWNEVSCVGRAAHRTFLVAEDLGLRSLAIPALGTGASRVSTEACANAIATALRTHLLLGGSRLRHVRFVLRDPTVLERFRDVAEEALHGDELTPTLDLGLEVEAAVSPDAATRIASSSP